jgi:hypothetical protein
VTDPTASAESAKAELAALVREVLVVNRISGARPKDARAGAAAMMGQYTVDDADALERRIRKLLAACGRPVAPEKDATRQLWQALRAAALDFNKATGETRRRLLAAAILLDPPADFFAPLEKPGPVWAPLGKRWEEIRDDANAGRSSPIAHAWSSRRAGDVRGLAVYVGARKWQQREVGTDRQLIADVAEALVQRILRGSRPWRDGAGAGFATSWSALRRRGDRARAGVQRHQNLLAGTLFALVAVLTALVGLAIQDRPAVADHPEQAVQDAREERVPTPFVGQIKLLDSEFDGPGFSGWDSTKVVLGERVRLRLRVRNASTRDVEGVQLLAYAADPLLDYDEVNDLWYLPELRFRYSTRYSDAFTTPLLYGAEGFEEDSALSQDPDHETALEFQTASPRCVSTALLIFDDHEMANSSAVPDYTEAAEYQPAGAYLLGDIAAGEQATITLTGTFHPGQEIPDDQLPDVAGKVEVSVEGRPWTSLESASHGDRVSVRIPVAEYDSCATYPINRKVVMNWQALPGGVMRVTAVRSTDAHEQSLGEAELSVTGGQQVDLVPVRGTTRLVPDDGCGRSVQLTDGITQAGVLVPVIGFAPSDQCAESRWVVSEYRVR